MSAYFDLRLRAVDEATLSAALALPPLAGGTFALPVRVLAEPAHAVHHETLRSLPTCEAAECE